MAPFTQNSLSSAGYSILELLAAMGIMSIVVAGLMDIGVLEAKVNRHVKDRLHLLELKSSIVNRIDCIATYSAVCDHSFPRIFVAKQPFGYAGAAYSDILAAGSPKDPITLAIQPFCRDNAVYVSYAYVRGPTLAADPLTGVPTGYRPMFAAPLCAKRSPPANLTCKQGSHAVGYDFDTGRYTCNPSP